jgi:hypothetical protein
LIVHDWGRIRQQLATLQRFNPPMSRVTR